MDAFLACTKAAVGGCVISLAMVFGGSTSFAEGLTGFGMTGPGSAPLIGGFSTDDLQALEHASAAEATIARMAAMDVENVIPAAVRSPGRAAGDTMSPVVEGDVFRYSAGVLPLLVTRPETAEPITMVGTTPRPGLVQPVGVSAASLRIRTDRSAR